MKRTLAGRSVEAIGLGCMGLSHGYGPPLDTPDGIRLIHRAIDLGYDHLDTARIYGAGANESLLGEALQGRRDRVLLASKCGLVLDGPKRGADGSAAHIRGSVEESLKRLRTDHIDLYYLHRRDFATPIEESAGVLAALIGEGKIGAYGLSEMSAATLRRAHAVHPVAAMQTELSPWTREAEIAVLDACAELGVTFVAFSPVARGVLAGAVEDPASLAPGDLRVPMPRFSPKNWPTNRALAEGFAALAHEAGVTPAQLSLGWVLAKGDHVIAIPGTTRIAHLEENAARRDWLPDAALVARVDALINQRTVAGPRYGEAMQRTIDTETFALATADFS